jgi:group II intron reverse transcriptase/maturase
MAKGGRQSQILEKGEKSEMLTAQAYLELVRNRSERNLNLERVYHNLQNVDLFLKAYGRLYANKGATTTGVESTDTIDGMSMTKVGKIIQTLNDGTFRWLPAKRIYIPKKNGKLRPLGLPSWTDKLVQEVMRLILEAYYEPKFSRHSHGFRPNRGCHTALEEILRHSRGTTWFIEGDIKGWFDNIDHETLLEIIGRNIKEPKLLKLLREMLKAGYVENWKYQNTYSGTPQGGNISPLLANIYLNELDSYVETEILPQHNRGGIKPINPEYKKIENRVHQARRKGQTELAEELGGMLNIV